MPANYVSQQIVSQEMVKEYQRPTPMGTAQMDNKLPDWNFKHRRRVW